MLVKRLQAQFKACEPRRDRGGVFGQELRKSGSDRLRLRCTQRRREPSIRGETLVGMRASRTVRMLGPILLNQRIATRRGRVQNQCSGERDPARPRLVIGSVEHDEIGLLKLANLVIPRRPVHWVTAPRHPWRKNFDRVTSEFANDPRERRIRGENDWFRPHFPMLNRRLPSASTRTQSNIEEDQQDGNRQRRQTLDRKLLFPEEHSRSVRRYTTWLTTLHSNLLETTTLEFSRPSGFQLRVDAIHLAAGESLAVRGVSGSGKSTLLALLSGELLPSKGEVWFDSACVSSRSDAFRRAFRIRNAGLVFQDFGLVESLSVLENVLLPFRLHNTLTLDADARDRAHTMLGAVGLHAKSARFPAQLSHGERQRTAIARALVTGARLILADEPTGNLDPALKHDIASLLRDIARSAHAALVVATHDESIIDRFDRALTITPQPAPELRGAQ